MIGALFSNPIIGIPFALVHGLFGKNVVELHEMFNNEDNICIKDQITGKFVELVMPTDNKTVVQRMQAFTEFKKPVKGHAPIQIISNLVPDEVN